MKRELWLMARAFANGIQLLNSGFCSDDKEGELDADEEWLIAEKVNSECSDMMVEDAEVILGLALTLPRKRFCERIGCVYHHPDTPMTHSYRDLDDVINRCDKCKNNEKSKVALDDRVDLFKKK